MMATDWLKRGVACPACDGEGCNWTADEECDFCGGSGVVTQAEFDAWAEEQAIRDREGPTL